MFQAKCVTTSAGSLEDQQHIADNNITIGNYYNIVYIDIGSTYVNVGLEGIDKPFNGVFFEYYLDGELYDIYSNNQFIGPESSAESDMTEELVE